MKYMWIPVASTRGASKPSTRPQRKFESGGGGGGGGVMRALVVVGSLLALALLAALVFLSSSSPAHAITAKITIEKVSGKEATYVARDNLIAPDGKSQTWHYLILNPHDPDCESSWVQSAVAYTEGSELVVSNVGGARISLCFRSVTPNLFGDGTTTLYEGLSIRDNTGPAVAAFHYYTGAANPLDHPVTLNAGHVGVAERSFIIRFDEHVIINKNGGDGPRLKLNVGEDRYAYAGSSQTNRARLIWYFSYYPQAGDNTADLDVIGFELNGATMADEHGNDFIASDYASFFNGHIAANQAIVVDTAAPEINQYTSNPPSTYNAGDIGDEIDINVEFKEAVEIDYNGGTGPRLKLNVGDNRYAYLTSGLTNRSRQVWQFDMFVTAGDNAADLDVIGWENNGATVTDEAGNPFQAGSAANSPFFNGNYADKLATVIDTVTPTISVSPSSDDSTRKRSITVRASSTDSDIDASSWRNKNIVGLASCDAAALHPLFDSGAQKTLDNEAYNGNRVCFGVKDTADNWAYATSGLITGIDRTPPVISPNPSTAHSTPKRQLTVTASSGSADVDNNSWRHKSILGSATCNAAGMTSGTSPGKSITLASEADNNRKVCFAVKDGSNNWAYAASGLITGIDRTAPVITVSSVVDNKVSATVSGSASFESQIITDNVCSSATSGSFAAYTAGVELTLPVGSRACFRATDSVSNVRYVASGVGVDTTTPVLDTTAPTISPNPSAADSTPKRQIRVFASSSSSDVDSSSWQHKVVSSSTGCNAVEMASGTSPGGSITLNSEADNNRKVCFGVKDTTDNWNYAASGLITGIDRTLPVITASPVTSDNGVSATVSDNSDNSPTFESQLIGNNICDFRTGGTFAAYTAGTVLSLPAGSRACFRATDSAGNISHAASGVGVVITDTPLPAININLVANNQVSATLVGALTNSPVLEVQIITGNVCSSATGGSFSAYTAGTVLSLPAGSRACFRVTDLTGRAAYTPSVAGQGSSSQRPDNTRRSSNTRQSPPRLVVSVLPGETLSASDNYGSGTTMSYMVRSDDACDDTTKGTFNVYQEGTALAPADVDYDHYVCFKSVDNNDPTSVAYAVSPLVVVDQPDPDQPPGSAASETDANAPPPTPDPGDSGVGTKPDPDQPPGSAASETDTSSRQPQPPGSTASGSEATDSAGSETDTDTPPPTPDPGDDDSSPLPALIVIGLIVVLTLAVAKRAFRKT